MTASPLLIHAIQQFAGDVWRTVYITSYGNEARETFESLSELSFLPLRAVAFSVSNLDFLSTQCKDFAVVALHTPDAPG